MIYELNTAALQGPPGPPTKLQSIEGPRPAASLANRGWVWCDDTTTPRSLYVSDGAAWLPVSGGGTSDLQLGTMAGTALEGTYAAAVANAAASASAAGTAATAAGNAAAVAQSTADGAATLAASTAGTVATHGTQLTALASGKLDATDPSVTNARAPSTAGTNGSVMVYAGGAWTSTGAGAADQLLGSNGAGAPSWRTVTAATIGAVPTTRTLTAGFGLTGGGPLSGDVTYAVDTTVIATRDYADAVASGLVIKPSVRVATTGNIALSGLQTIDGVSLTTADRVLVKDQTTGSQNGIYAAASGAWARTADADTSAEVTSGMFTFVSEGATQAKTSWALSTPDPITLGTTALTFSQFSGAGTYAAGTGLSLVGTTFAVLYGTTSGTAAQGNDARLSDQRTPLDGSVTSAKIPAGTLTAAHVAAANVDGVAGTASMRTLGTGATQAAAGNDSRFTNARAPTGAAGGDLGGTYPDPTVVDFTFGSDAHGDLPIRGAAAYKRLAAGVAGRFLKTLGAGVDAAWAAITTVGELGTRTTYVGGAQLAYRTSAVSTTLTVDDYAIGVTDLSVSRQVTLPGGTPAGTVFVVKDKSRAANGTNRIMVNAASGTVEGVSNYTAVTTPGGSAGFISDGTNYDRL